MWTEEIMSEVTRNLISKFEMPAALAERREKKIREAFPESLVDGYEPLIDKMENDPKDRHRASNCLLRTIDADRCR
jgi:hypothetical protein